MKKNLFLITSLFPFGNAETFLETEINYSCELFQKVTIIPLNQSLTKRETPNNCNILPYKPTKKSLFLNIISRFLNTLIIKEFLSAFFKKNTIGIWKTMINSLIRAVQISEFLEQEINKVELENTLFYSYWCDDSALALAFFKTKNPNIISVSRAHGWDLYFETNKFGYLPFKPYITKNLNALFPISETGNFYITKKWASYLNPITSYLGVTPNLSVDLNIDQSKIIIVSCSNAIKIKRIELIIEALSLIKNHNIKWVHFGNGPELQNLMKLALKLPSNIIAEWKGMVSNKEIISYYKESKPNLFINVSSTEGIPVSIMEAFSFGIPVIATDVGGTGELVKHKYNGLLLKENPSTDEICSCINYFINLDKRKIEIIRKNAFKTINKYFNAKKNYTNFYEKCLSFFNKNYF
jgi:glycosyltransferase involved in cell wall biosynthesis